MLLQNGQEEITQRVLSMQAWCVTPLQHGVLTRSSPGVKSSKQIAQAVGVVPSGMYLNFVMAAKIFGSAGVMSGEGAVSNDSSNANRKVGSV